MPQKIHYGDDLFYINLIIKTLRSGLALEIDGEFFSERFAEDCFFVERVLQRLYDFLVDNPKLINRQEQLRSFYLTLRDFIDLLDELAAASGRLAHPDQAMSQRLSELRSRQATSAETLKIGLFQGGASDASQIDIVSRDELSGLLTE